MTRALERSGDEVTGLRGRVDRLDWPGLRDALDRVGHARAPSFLTAEECGALARLYSDDGRFRKTVCMEKHRFGLGEYRYFGRPLPALVAALRTVFYPHLARVANEWEARLGTTLRYEKSLRAFTKRCLEAGQERPTPLLLRYEAGGFNCLHQDLYGEVAFPLQVAICLSRRDVDFRGGEFLLVEQRPRQQSRGDVIALDLGEVVIFPTRTRPVKSARGWVRASVRHGVSRLHEGERLTLGVIFHDAR